MSELAIRVEGLGKQYRVGSRGSGPRYKSLRDSLAALAAAPARAATRLLSGNRVEPSKQGDTFWAIRNVSLEIGCGEVVGIIGRNGAGKSTLLKILSRITEPSTGLAELYGRVGSLLEVGTGFHPELTGKENIFLNGAILGMKRLEIQNKFDEIVSFAEVDRFLDTPVKFYSSGMQTRLAFSVAAHLEPEILVVDEVLAVGDLGFQQKCLGKMGAVAQSGRTVLFVSHQLNQVRRLCTRAIWLDAGGICQDGAPARVVSEYEASFQRRHSPTSTNGNHTAVGFVGWEFPDHTEGQTHTLNHFGRLTVRFWLQVPRPIHNWHHGITLLNQDGQLLWGTATGGTHLAAGLYAIDYSLPSLPLRPGYYEWLASIYEDHHLLHLWNGLPSLNVAAPPVTHPKDEWSGLLNVPYELTIQPVGPAATNHDFRMAKESRALSEEQLCANEMERPQS
jgi:lipopolysaccharide transport system ATP-binding protein